MIKVFLLVVAFFTFFGLLFDGIDYGFHALAVITQNPSLDTVSYKNDRFLNGLTVKTYFQSNATVAGSYLTVRFDNESNQAGDIRGRIFCGENNESSINLPGIHEDIPDGWHVDANSQAVYRLEVRDLDGTSFEEDDFPTGEITCQIIM